MLRYGLGLLAGGYALQFCASLPPDMLRWPAVAAALAALGLRRFRLCAVVLLGFCIAWHAARAAIDDRLAPAHDGATLAITGVVADFPERRNGSLRFLVETRDSRGLPQRIRLSWYEAPVSPRLGETWTMQVRLRRPRGFANPVGFDYEKWLFRQRIGATGYVLAHPANRRLGHAPVALLAQLRQHVADRIRAVAGDNDASAVLQAVVAGARHRITRRQWDRYAASGTSHLMAISGLHIGLAAGGAWLLARVLLAPLSRWRCVHDLAALGALVSAAGYAALSGFAVPAQRALVMAVAVVGVGLLRRRIRPLWVLALAGILVFLGDPLSILAPGFRLSFAAVALLLWAACRYSCAAPQPGAARWAGEIFRRLPPLQLVLLFGLMPLTVLEFGRMAWLAPIVNLLALPVFNLVTVPAALLGTLLDGPFAAAGDVLLRVSWYSVRSVLTLVALAADWPPARVYVATAAWPVLPLALLAALWALLPPGWPGRRLAWIAGLAVAVARPATPPAGCVEITTLDVGQGLAMVLRTRQRVLVFDTGPAFRSGGDTGQLVLVPYLRAAGIDRVDLLMISHADTDHAGGARSLVAAVAVDRLLAGEPIDSTVARQGPCREGQAWTWDGVSFAVLHPVAGEAASGNNRSCVLQVSAGSHRALLTGDIESAAEQRLLASGSLSAVDIALVPHHGSRTSSAATFVTRLGPEVALVSAGFANRWGLPQPDVTSRWQKAGARVLNTAHSGAIGIRLCADVGIDAIAEHRLSARKYWHEGGR